MNWFRFLFEFIKHPRTIGGVIPSSGFLSRAIKELVFHRIGENGIIIEVGAGTGALTKALSQLNKPIYALEPNERLRKRFIRQYPEVHVVDKTLQKAEEEVRALIAEKPCVVVSSLPLQVFTSEARQEVLGTLERILLSNPKTILIQYTYRLGNPLSFSSKIISQHECSVTRNIPPAHVWSYRVHAS